MPRQARLFGNSGYEHVVIRGINKQVLFIDERDYMKYLALLEKYSAEQGVKVCAYCLMDNHVHLLLFDNSENIPLLMKKIGVSYSTYFNTKYERSGCLLQNRYHNEPILSERQLHATIRYILNNPVKAGICRSPDNYKWSSYGEYWKEKSFVDNTLVTSIFGSVNQFEEILNNSEINECNNIDRILFSDEWASTVLTNCIGTNNGVLLQKYCRVDRDAALRQLKEAGLSIRQIERLTGINRGIIQRA